MNPTPPIPRQKLLAILSHHGIAPAAFDALRADAYEKRIAAHSLTDLELLYATVLNPALSYVQMQPLCPPGPTDVKPAARRPSRPSATSNTVSWPSKPSTTSAAWKN